ncbi:transketolase [Pleomorphomonas sp. NRK KF1]|uniref:transketolase n=1 Tax=Pleomorphomonas sp. NRK KF1 TaxID=2943000 RepID=UPI0020446F8B|nr:transketolase [Pleomorphomonas sp. NRK KF1]MCM5553855.1 transketolase [Pleomorphomonas sp. NRK KF1]
MLSPFPSSTALANAIRILTIDAVNAAGCGHPGAPMGMAEMGTALWTRHLSHNPADPKWVNRDRFVLSNGHASMLIYSMLHLTGYDVSLDDIKNFRKLGGRLPGHPEYGHTPGVETTTGPIGQGIANAVGFALAEKLLGIEFNRPGFPIVDHHTYAFMGDGCLMEGISHEACSLAGTWKLNKLIAFWDDNGISIDGRVSDWFSDNTPKRFEAYGWHVITGVDGHDVEAVDKAIQEAKAQTDKPTLICCRTIIGKGSPNCQDTPGVHGNPLSVAEIAATRAALGITSGPFEIADDVRAAWNGRDAGIQRQQKWQALFDAYRAAFPKEAAEFERRINGQLPENFATEAAKLLATIDAEAKSVATRHGSQRALNALAPLLPEVLSGSADLHACTMTEWNGCKHLRANALEEGGNVLDYGIREFGMMAIVNGLALHGGFLPIGATFLVFSEYARNAIRMAALMKVRSLFVLTHDSIGMGEDGPTHQAVEQTATLRLVPNLDVWRPCDSVETFVAWQTAIEHRDCPTALVLTRQRVPHQSRDAARIEAIKRGGYVLSDCAGKPDAVIIATGSEVGLAMEAQKKLAAEGVATRVVSLPSHFVFEQQDAAYRNDVLPAGIPRVAVEAGVTDYWRKYVGLEGAVVGIDRFGECGPAPEVYEFFGITTDGVVKAVRSVLA